jgi:alkyl hydroperoxide reductase subunit AhpC
MVRRFLGLLFSHPADFTPVCTTELGTVANYYPEFVKRNTKICIKCSSESHMKLDKDIEEVQDVTLQYPIIADESGKWLTYV